MATFTDDKSRTWNITLNLGTARAVKRERGFDFLCEGREHPILKLAGDMELLGNVLWSLCEKQAIERGVTEEGFGEGIAGDSLDAATNALAEAYSDFCPNPTRREILRNLWRSVREVERLQLEKAQAEVTQLDPNKLATFGTE